MFTLETCRHPLGSAQVAVCERYAAALGSSPEEVHLLRVAIDEGVALDDPQSFFSSTNRYGMLQLIIADARVATARPVCDSTYAQQ